MKIAFFPLPPLDTLTTLRLLPSTEVPILKSVSRLLWVVARHSR